MLNFSTYLDAGTQMDGPVHLCLLCQRPEKRRRGMSVKRDYYEVLGISRSASIEEIKRAYRRLARQYHPDVNKSPDAEAMFKEINEAYQVLSDPEKRAMYDRYGHAGVDENAGAGGFDFEGFGGFGDFGDIFDELFGFGSRRRRTGGPRRGEDIYTSVTISFEESIFGTEREIEIRREETCPHCHGTGAEPGTSPTRCPVCGGTGQVRRVRQSILGSFVQVTTCPRCGGTGEIITTPCSVCHGRKTIVATRKIKVKIPAGIEDGMQLRLSGEGHAGKNGGPSGNLYVEVHVKPHPFFKRKGDDIYLELPINIAQAALGDVVPVPTLYGSEELKIPAGTQSGKQFVLKGKGAPNVRGSGKGDEIVTVKVVVPTKLSKKQRELLQELGATLGRENLGKDKSLFDKIVHSIGDAFGK